MRWKNLSHSRMQRWLYCDDMMLSLQRETVFVEKLFDVGILSVLCRHVDLFDRHPRRCKMGANAAHISYIRPTIQSLQHIEKHEKIISLKMYLNCVTNFLRDL